MQQTCDSSGNQLVDAILFIVSLQDCYVKCQKKKKQNKTKNYGYGQKAGTRGQIKNCP